MKRRLGFLVAGVLAATMLAGCGSSSAGTTSGRAKTDYPTKNISIVCPYSAGGTTDLCIRGMVEAIPDGTLPSGVNMITNNVTGGGGLVGANQFRNAASDGYTIGIVNCDLVLNQVNGNTDISYEEFTPLACLMKQANLILVNANSQFDTFEDLVSYAKEHPGEVKVGNSGEGTIPRLSAEAIEKALGLEFKYVTYDGDTNSVTAIVAGEVDVTICSAAPAVGQLEAGTIKAVAVTDNERMDSFPDVPGMGELYEELSDVHILTWVYLACKNDVDPTCAEYLQNVFAKANESDSFHETQKSFSIEQTEFTTSDDALGFMADQYDFYNSLIND